MQTKTDIAGNHAQSAFLDAEADSGDGFGVAVSGEELGWGDGFRERGPSESEVADPWGETHRGASLGSVVVV